MDAFQKFQELFAQKEEQTALAGSEQDEKAAKHTALDQSNAEMTELLQKEL